ncbi:MAG: metalloregulator ArsR/SmtB family transcription factor [Betaproteobacteria bacterium]|nr:metalloregulator ArsR/SmtB family transcription factor [Betaproteobacteria bacterium]
MSDFASQHALDGELLRAHAREACALLKTLANEDRLLLLCALGDTQKNVGELEALTGITQPTLSQQLGVLRHEGIVETEKKGKYVYYRVREGHTVRVISALCEIYCAS